MNPVILHLPPSIQFDLAENDTNSLDDVMDMLARLWGGRDKIPKMSQEEYMKLLGSPYMPNQTKQSLPKYKIQKVNGQYYFCFNNKRYKATLKTLPTVVETFRPIGAPHRVRNMGRVTRILEVDGCPIQEENDGIMPINKNIVNNTSTYEKRVAEQDPEILREAVQQMVYIATKIEDVRTKLMAPRPKDPVKKAIEIQRAEMKKAGMKIQRPSKQTKKERERDKALGIKKEKPTPKLFSLPVEFHLEEDVELCKWMECSTIELPIEKGTDGFRTDLRVVHEEITKAAVKPPLPVVRMTSDPFKETQERWKDMFAKEPVNTNEDVPYL
jgi:hypothetical protein